MHLVDLVDGDLDDLDGLLEDLALVDLGDLLDFGDLLDLGDLLDFGDLLDLGPFDDLTLVDLAGEAS